jgi:uncharacterized membrane protein
MKANPERRDRLRLTGILILSFLLIATGTLWAFTSIRRGDIGGAISGSIIALIILIFAFFVFTRGSKDVKQGYPLEDERSKRVMEKAMALAFLATLYLLLGIGWLSEDIIKFRDVSQATGAAIGGMAILFAIFWLYFNKKEI